MSKASTGYDDSGPAFPCSTELAGSAFGQGLTKREWFAGMAMLNLVELVAHPGSDLGNAPSMLLKYTPQVTAEAAYAIADAMIAEGEKQ